MPNHWCVKIPLNQWVTRLWKQVPSYDFELKSCWQQGTWIFVRCYYCNAPGLPDNFACILVGRSNVLSEGVFSFISISEGQTRVLFPKYRLYVIDRCKFWFSYKCWWCDEISERPMALLGSELRRQNPRVCFHWIYFYAVETSRWRVTFNTRCCCSE